MRISQSRLHLGLTVFWATLVLPTALSAMSLYANLASHWAAFEAARASEAAQAAIQDS
jgi:hypothetical protein